MRRDLESTKQTLWELRGICLDVRQLFSRMGYGSARLQRRQDAFLHAVGAVIDQATTLQLAVSEHDSAALALLQQLQAGRQQAPPSSPSVKNLPARSCPWRAGFRSARGRVSDWPR
jgi:hypothetical protein